MSMSMLNMYTMVVGHPVMHIATDVPSNVPTITEYISLF